MIADAKTVESGQSLQADVCIVGAGAAGIAIALQFEHSAKTVFLLEAGGMRPEARTQALYEGSVADASLHPTLETYRRRGLGGSTAIWGGRCVPFDPVDFAVRPWVPGGAAWPIGYETLLPYYSQASALCETGDFVYADAGIVPPILNGFQGHRFTDTAIERFSCPTHFGRRYGARLKAARNITVLLHANATGILTDDTGASVLGLRVATLTGRRFLVRAGKIVLAAGGLEVPRLLLASRDRHSSGLGNAHGQVGRYYMTHIAGTIGEVAANKPNHGYTVSDDGIFCRRRFALRAECQRDLCVGNFIARLHHPRLSDPSHRTGALSAVFLAKPFVLAEYAARLHGSAKMRPAEWLAHFRNLALDFPGVTRFAADVIRRRVLAPRKLPSLVVHPRSGLYSLEFHAEQVADPENRVELGQGVDELGMPRLHVTWRPSPEDFRTVRLSLAALAEDFAQSGCARLKYDPEQVEEACLRDGAYGGHHIGTARMSHSPHRGVVDATCRVHGMSNLFVAGSAVFPTSGQANPTLTIVALAIRLAKEELLF